MARDSSEISSTALPYGAAEMTAALDALDLLDEPTFRWLEFELISRYRCYEEEQELIAATLSRLALCDPSPISAERLEEMLAMLVHVHDPLI